LTWPLWFGPLLLLALVALAVVRSRMRRGAAPAPLDEEARKQLDALLGSSAAPSGEPRQ
jgi:cytochrome c-type biogenesis protein CcmH